MLEGVTYNLLLLINLLKTVKYDIYILRLEIPNVVIFLARTTKKKYKKK